MAIIKGIYPTKVVPDKWWKMPEIDPKSLRPKPEREILLIVGDASGVIKDLSKFLDFGVVFDTMAINYSPKIIPWPIQHFVAGDSQDKDMKAMAKAMTNGCIKHCWNPDTGTFDVYWKRTTPGWNGTTANLCVKIGIALGYTRLILAGVPIDSSGNWYAPILKDNDIKKNKNHKYHLWKWTEIASRPVGRLIRSMSGNTAELLGKPTKNWLGRGV